jgi:hypothetical protein
VLTHNALQRTIRHAEANDYVRHNVAALVRPPTGQPGRPSKSMTTDQAVALLAAAESSRLAAYVVLCLLAGVRTEEARALTWDHVDMVGDPAAGFLDRYPACTGRGGRRIEPPARSGRLSGDAPAAEAGAIGGVPRFVDRVPGVSCLEGDAGVTTCPLKPPPSCSARLGFPLPDNAGSFLIRP